MIEAFRQQTRHGIDWRKELRGVAATLALVALVSACVFFLIENGLVKYGSVIFLVPVVIAATQWGLIASIVGAIAGVFASAFFFYPPLYSFHIDDPHEVLNLVLFSFVAVVTSHLATQLKRQAEIARQREIDMRDLYAFSRRLAVAFDVTDIHKAIEDHLSTVLERNVLLLANVRDTAAISRSGLIVPETVLAAATSAASGYAGLDHTVTIKGDGYDVWLVRAVSPKSPDFGVVAINLGRASQDEVDGMRVRVDAVLADATATLERLGVAHAISEARMRSRTDQLREALIGSVSHELRTPLASIMGAATVIAPALESDKKLKQLIHDVRDEAERLNNDIQNLLDASRISSNGINPHTEWADPADIVNAALERCRRRMSNHRVVADLPADLPVIRVDPVLIQQALIQVFDNAVKYSRVNSPIVISARAADGNLTIRVADQGTGLTADEKQRMWQRFSRGERHVATVSGSGLGLWIANAFVAANAGTVEATSDGPGRGATLTITLPVEPATVSQMESETDE